MCITIEAKRTASLSEHAEAIKAAIKAAEDDGFKLACDLTYDSWENGLVEKVELDLWRDHDWINIYTEERP